MPVLVTQRVLTLPGLSLAARGLYAVTAAFREDEQGARAVLDAADGEVLGPLLEELAAAGYAWHGPDGTFIIGDPLRRNAPAAAPWTPAPKSSGPSRHGWAYAIADSKRRMVKIGTSRDVARRLRGLQTSSPLTLNLIWQDRGGAALEAHLHEAFSSRRVRGEWFDFAGVDAAALIANAAENFGRDQ